MFNSFEEFIISLISFSACLTSSKNALDEIFTILLDAVGVLGLELDFAYNPGTSEIDKSGFKELFWDVKNIYYEKLVARFTEYTKECV